MPKSDRRIDHLVLAVHDIDAAGKTYERMGFQVGKRNRHPWGTENRLVQFGSSFLELISVGDGAEIEPHRPRHFSFGAFVRDYLAEREGLAMFVLDSPDAEADALRFARTGIGDYEPFFFERRGRRSSGEDVRVAFSLAFATHAALPEAAFFVCEQHEPDNFWNPDFQQHSNGATDVAEITCAASEPGVLADFLADFAGVPVPDVTAEGFSIKLSHNGRICVTRDAVRCGLTSLSVSVPDLDRMSRILTDAGLAFRTPVANRITVDANETFGVSVEFVLQESTA
ncbi:MAG: VOC family protein [Paracoccaceae bacterium]